MEVSTSAAIAGALVFAGVAVWQYRDAHDAQRQLVALNQQLASAQHQLTDKSNAEYEVQKRACSDRSQRYFDSLGYSESQAKDNVSTTFQNHYSRRLGRCLMTLDSTAITSGHMVISKQLIDTDERQTFGEYGWVSSDTKKFYEQKPMQCHLAPPDKAESYCQSTDEYDAYVKEILSS